MQAEFEQLGNKIRQRLTKFELENILFERFDVRKHDREGQSKDTLWQ